MKVFNVWCCNDGPAGHADDRLRREHRPITGCIHPCDSSNVACSCGPPNLVFTKYIEGSEGTELNKALEVTNGSFVPVFDGQCLIRIYVDTNPSNVVVIPVHADLWPGEVWTVCHDSVGFDEYCDELDSTLLFDGNDAIELHCSGPID